MRWGAEHVKNEFDKSFELDNDYRWVKDFQEVKSLRLNPIEINGF